MLEDVEASNVYTKSIRCQWNNEVPLHSQMSVNIPSCSQWKISDGGMVVCCFGNAIRLAKAESLAHVTNWRRN